MTEWTSVTEDLTTEQLIAQARVAATSYPHKAECAYILSDRIETLLSEVKIMQELLQKARDVIGPIDGTLELWLEIGKVLQASISEEQKP